MKPIPIKAAREIAYIHDAPEVVIMAYDPNTGTQHVTTYGITKEQSEEAAKYGNWLKEKLGWPPEKCDDKPKHRICPKCKSNNIRMINAYQDICQTCKHVFQWMKN